MTIKTYKLVTNQNRQRTFRCLNKKKINYLVKMLTRKLKLLILKFLTFNSNYKILI